MSGNLLQATTLVNSVDELDTGGYKKLSISIMGIYFLKSLTNIKRVV
jgi:hypothetical protein